MLRAPILYALSVFTCFAVGAGRAQTSLANCGKGLVLFSVEASEASRLPPYLKLIANDGWTLEVQPVEAAFAREGEYAGALRRGIDAARQAGCRRIALIGESFGAWVSLLANASFETPIDGESVQAVIAIDASAARSEGPRDAWREHKFMNILKAQDATHLAILLYDAPADKAAERQGEVGRSLANRFQDVRAVADTAAFDASEGPHSDAFAQRYGPRLIQMLDGPEPVGPGIQAPAQK